MVGDFRTGWLLFLLGSSTVCLLWEVRAVAFSPLASQCLVPCLAHSRHLMGRCLDARKESSMELGTREPQFPTLALP